MRLTTRGGGRSPDGRDLFPSLFLLEQVDKCVFIPILELRRIEVAGFGFDDVSCQVEHLLGKL